MKTLLISTFLVILIIVAVTLNKSGYESGYEKFYYQDKEGFWKFWKKSKKEAFLCAKNRKVSGFLYASVKVLNVPEIKKANAEAIEYFALHDPFCFIPGLEGITFDFQDKLIKNYLAQPQFFSQIKIEKSLSRVWSEHRYNRLRTLYFKHKAANKKINADNYLSGQNTPTEIIAGD